MAVKPVRLMVVVLAIVLAGQLVGTVLQRLRPPDPPTIFSAAGSLADPRAPASDAANPDVTIFLFSDYACPLCRAMHPDLRRLAAADRRVRIVYRDWPILGPRSVRAAELAIASVGQGRHSAFDDELMRRGGPLDERSLQAAAARAGVDWVRLEHDVTRRAVETEAFLARTDSLARGVGFSGTPTMVIGPYLVSGRISYERMRELVASARN